MDYLMEMDIVRAGSDSSQRVPSARNDRSHFSYIQVLEKQCTASCLPWGNEILVVLLLIQHERGLNNDRHEEHGWRAQNGDCRENIETTDFLPLHQHQSAALNRTIHNRNERVLLTVFRSKAFAEHRVRASTEPVQDDRCFLKLRHSRN